MGVLSKGETFADTQHITSTRVNNLVDNATFTSSAVDNSSTALSSGAIIVKNLGITTAKIANDAVDSTKLDSTDTDQYVVLDIKSTKTRLEPYVDASVSGTLALDLDNGNFQQWTLNGNVTAVSAPANLAAGQQFTAIITNGTGSGPYTWTGFDSTWKWFGGDEPALTATDGAIDILTGTTDGTNVYVTLLKGFA